jgi:hypothetical protein
MHYGPAVRIESIEHGSYQGGQKLTIPLFLQYSENWSSGEANRKRGAAWLDQIYKANHASTENTLAAHKDFSKLKQVNSPSQTQPRPQDPIQSNPNPSIPLLSSMAAAIKEISFLTEHDLLTNKNSLALHRNHLRPLPLRPQHPGRRRHRTRSPQRDHDAESTARDGLAFARDEADRGVF